MSGLAIIVGTYEEYTVGYQVQTRKTESTQLCLKEIFSTHNHTSSVRSIATHGKYLASGGADDRICIFDLETGLLKDDLLHHNGTVNCLSFTSDGSFLFSGSHDGVISAINMKRLVVDKTWKNAHKAAVLSITIHPSDKVALSLGGDMTLRTWDLVTGRTIYTRSLRKDPKFVGGLLHVQWSPDGSYFALMGLKVVDIVCIETTKSIKTVQCPSRPASLCWLSDTEIAIGLDDGHLLMLDVTEEQGEPENLQLYKTRIKAMAVVENYLATASSSGEVSLWKIVANDFSELCTVSMECRPTCLVLVNAEQLELFKYLKQLEDSKEQIPQIILKPNTIGKVVIEQESSKKQGKEDSRRVQTHKKSAAAGKKNAPTAKKHSATLNSIRRPKRNRNTSNMWIEEDIIEATPKKQKKAKRNSL